MRVAIKSGKLINESVSYLNDRHVFMMQMCEVTTQKL
jgi:hypothetical protein